MIRGCHSPSFWNEMFTQVLKTKPKPILKKFRGLRIGVDMMWIFNFAIDDMAVALARNQSGYTPHHLLKMIELRHERLCEAFLDPVYVLPGAQNPKEIMTAEQKGVYEEVGQIYKQAQQEPITDKDAILNFKNKLKAIQVMDPSLIRYVGQWMKAKGSMEVVNAPFETAWQLLELEKTGDISGIISDDGTLAMAGAEVLMFNPAYGPQRVETRLYELHSTQVISRYSYNFKAYSRFLPEVATLYGTRYWVRDANRLPVKVAVKLKWPEVVEAIEKGEPPFDPAFDIAVNQLRYGPVARENEDGSCTIEPLRHLPDGETSWEKLLGFDPIAQLTTSKDDYMKARNFEDGLSFVPSTPPQEEWLHNIRCEDGHEIVEIEEEKEEIAW